MRRGVKEPLSEQDKDEAILIGVISDTHSHCDEAAWREAFEGARWIFHAGDIGDQEVLDALARIAPVVAVKGNIDGGDLRFLPEEVTEVIGGKRIAMRHIAGSPKRPNKAARRLLVREQPDVLIVGHSHIAVVARVDFGCLWINPGAAGRHGFHVEKLAMRLKISPRRGEIALERVRFGPRTVR